MMPGLLCCGIHWSASGGFPSSGVTTGPIRTVSRWTTPQKLRAAGRVGDAALTTVGDVVRIALNIVISAILVLVTAFAGAIAGLDIFTSLTAAASMVGNVGPAFGQLGPTANYGFLPTPLKLWYCFAMLAGRLEIYTLLIMIARVCHAPQARVEG